MADETVSANTMEGSKGENMANENGEHLGNEKGDRMPVEIDEEDDYPTAFKLAANVVALVLSMFLVCPPRMKMSLESLVC